MSYLVHTLFWNPTESRLRAVWRIVIPFGVFFATLLGIQKLLSPFSFPTVVDHLLRPGRLLVSAAVAVTFAARILDGRSVRDFGFELGAAWWRDFVGAVAIGIVLHGLISLAHYGLGWARVTELVSSGELLENGSFALAVAISFVLFVGVGVWEEILFRGVFIKNAAEGLSAWSLSRRQQVWGAWLVSTVVFGLLHFFSAGGEGIPVAVVVASAVVSGGYFGLAYILTGSLAFPIGLHIATNFASTAVFGGTAPRFADFPALIRFETSFPGFWESTGGLTVIFGILTLAIVVGWVYLTRGTVSVHESIAEPPVDLAR